MKIINIIFFIIISELTFGQTVYNGKSSIIIDNKKDIIHICNNSYKKKLVDEATINAIKQAFPTLINIEEFSFQDFDQADNGIQPTDRIIINSKSGKSVKWQQIDNPAFRKDLRGNNKWECTVSGYVKEDSNYIPQKNKLPKKKYKKHNYNIGPGIGITMPQVFKANLFGGEILPRWDVTINPIYNVGLNFGVTEELMLGLNFAFSKVKLVTDINTIQSDCYGGRFQIGMFRHTVNPFISLTALYGSEQNVSFAIKQIGVGIDFLKGKFKIGCEFDAFWFSSNYHNENIEFNNNGFFSTTNGFNDIRFNIGINMKFYF